MQDIDYAYKKSKNNEEMKEMLLNQRKEEKMTYYVIQEMIKGEVKKFFSFYEFIETVKHYAILEIPFTVTYVN